MGACKVSADAGSMGVAGAKVIEPGQAARSVLLLRMLSTDAYRMPPLSTHQIDEAGTDLVETWINGLTGCM